MFMSDAFDSRKIAEALPSFHIYAGMSKAVLIVKLYVIISKLSLSRIFLLSLQQRNSSVHLLLSSQDTEMFQISTA